MWLLEEASTWSEREAQMRVLLDARGHKIEELQCILSDLKDSSEREIRITKHQLLMMTGAISSVMFDCRSTVVVVVALIARLWVHVLSLSVHQNIVTLAAKEIGYPVLSTCDIHTFLKVLYRM